MTEKLLGSREPRLFTKENRPLTPKTSRGFELIDFARLVLREPLLPWQEELAIRALELNQDGTYRYRTVLVLVARQNGKTHFLRTLTLWRLYMDGVKLVLGVAQDLSIAREVWTECIATIKSVPDLSVDFAKHSARNGDEWFALSSGARYKIAAANRSAGRGLSVDQLNMDEIREQRSWDAWSALSKTTMARPYAQTWAISNAGDAQSVVVNHLRSAALSGSDPSIGIFEWSAEDGCALDDPKQWAYANPGLGHTISEQAIRSALGTDPVNVFRTEVLCQTVSDTEGAIDLTAWRTCADPSGSLRDVRDRVIACVDVAPDEKHVSLVGGACLSDGRTRVEVLRAWNGTADARKELPDVLSRLKPAALAWFPGPAAALAADIRALGAVELGGQKMVEACQEFSSLVSARQIIHPADPLLDSHISGATKLRRGDSWVFSRRIPGTQVDALYAAAGAVYAARTLPAEKPRRVSRIV